MNLDQGCVVHCCWALNDVERHGSMMMVFGIQLQKKKKKKLGRVHDLEGWHNRERGGMAVLDLGWGGAAVLDLRIKGGGVGIW